LNWFDNLTDRLMTGSDIRFLSTLWCLGYFLCAVFGQAEGIFVYPFPEIKPVNSFCINPLWTDQLETSTSTPGAYPGHLTVHRAPGGRNLSVALEGWGIWTGFFSSSDVILPWVFFRFLQGLTDLQNRCSPLLVNNSFKRVFKRRLKVSLRHISLWKACKVFDWRRNLSLKRGSSVLIGGAFERLFCPEGREFEQANLQKFKCLGGCPQGGGDVELLNWSAH